MPADEQEATRNRARVAGNRQRLRSSIFMRMCGCRRPLAPPAGTDRNSGPARHGKPWYRVGNYKLIGVKHTGSPFTDPDLRLKAMREARIDFQVLSPSPLTYFHHIELAEALAFCRRHNDAMAELVRTYPDKLGGLAALPMQDPGCGA